MTQERLFDVPTNERRKPEWRQYDLYVKMSWENYPIIRKAYDRSLPVVIPPPGPLMKTN